jgi:hypothetical protein
MTKGTQHIVTNFRHFAKHILEMEYSVKNIPGCFFYKKKNCKKKTNEFLIKGIAENCHNCLQYNKKGA